MAYHSQYSKTKVFIFYKPYTPECGNVFYGDNIVGKGEQYKNLY